MEPDDPRLSKLLREWHAPDAPPALDKRILDARASDIHKNWWSYLLTGSIRVPVSMGLAVAVILLVMTIALLRQRAPELGSASVSLIDFGPVSDVNVRVIRGHEPN